MIDHSIVSDYEGQARSLEERYRGLLQAVPDALVITDGQGNIALANQEAERLFRYAPGELLGRPIHDLVPDRFRDTHPSFRRDYFADPRTRPMGSERELWARRQDGSEFAVEISLSPLRVGGDTLVIAAVRDVTVRRRTESKFRALLEAAPDAMVIVNGSGVITLVNSQAERLFGYAREQLIGQSVEVLVPRLLRASHSRRRARARKQAPARPVGSGIQLLGRRRDGAEVPVEVSLSPVETEDGAFLIAAVRDVSERLRLEDARREVTERARAEREVRSQNEALERRVAERTSELAASNRELEAFTYSVSHDLRAPLRHVDGFSRMLLEEAGSTLSPRATHFVQRIREGTQHMGRLVDDLLNLAQLGRRYLHPRDVVLGDMVAEVVSVLRAEVPDREIQWRIGSLPIVRCDPGLMRVVLMNLLSNAVKYTRARTPAIIEVAQGTHLGREVFLVRDNGVGFDMRYADKLFGVFQRLHREEDFEGTGVGLATVQRIVHKHGGEIWAEAVPDRGATFFVAMGSAPEAGD